MPPTPEFEFMSNACLINCREDCRCEANKGQNTDKEIGSNANEITAKGQSVFSNALRTLRWSKSKILVNNNETVLNLEKCRPLISLKEVAEHDSYDDCWIILYDRVYDVTNFLYEVNINTDLADCVEMFKLHEMNLLIAIFA